MVLHVVQPAAEDRDLAAHQRSFTAFRHMVTFAAAHVALTLACVALAFIGHAETMALLIWIGGTLVLLGTLFVHRSSTPPSQPDDGPRHA